MKGLSLVLALKMTMEKMHCTEEMDVDPASAEKLQEWEISENSELDENEESSSETSCKLHCMLCVCLCKCDCVGEDGCVGEAALIDSMFMSYACVCVCVCDCVGVCGCDCMGDAALIDSRFMSCACVCV